MVRGGVEAWYSEVLLVAGHKLCLHMWERLGFLLANASSASC